MRIFSILAAIAAWCLCHPAAAQFAAVINVPPDVAPPSIGSNTQLNLGEGGTLPEDFRAGALDDTSTNIEINISGGFARRLHAESGAAVHVTGGQLVDPIVSGGTLDLSGGRVFSSLWLYGSGATIGGTAWVEGVQANAGSSLTIEGGEVRTIVGLSGSAITIHDGAAGSIHTAGTATIYGGALNGSYRASGNGLLTIFDGPVGGAVGAHAGSRADVHGGAYGDGFFTEAGGSLNLYGGDFQIDGTPVAQLANVGDTAVINLPPTSVLSGVLADGTPIALWGGDNTLVDGTLTLHAAAIPPLGPPLFPPVIIAPAMTPPAGLRGGQTMFVTSGHVPANFTALPDSRMEIFGGTVGENFEAVGAEVRVSGGELLGSVEAFDGADLEILGGIAASPLIRGGVVTHRGADTFMAAGEVSGYSKVHAGGRMELAGGRVNDVHAAGGELVISGGIVTDLTSSNGATVIITDGGHSPVDFANDFTFIDSQVTMSGGQLIDGFGVLNNSQLHVSGGLISNIHTANSTTTVTGGQVGFNNFTGENVINIHGGEVGLRTDTNAHVTLTGGKIVGYIGVENRLNVTGGAVEAHINAMAGSELAISGGSAEEAISARSGSDVAISGGQIDGPLLAYAGSAIEISGAVIGDLVQTETGSAMTLAGGEFRLDGVPVAGLDNAGDTLQINVPVGAMLSGTLADGSPFAFYNDGFGLFRGEEPYDQHFEDSLADGTLTLRRAEMEAPGPPTLNLPSDPPPTGLRQGQSLTLNDGGAVGDNFIAAFENSVTIDGGTVGKNFEVVNGEVNISGGAIGNGFDAFLGSQVRISGGTVGEKLSAHGGSHVSISGGEVGPMLMARGDSLVEVSGGYVSGTTSIYDAQLNVSGGLVDDVDAGEDAVITVTGGLVRRLDANALSHVNIHGGEIGAPVVNQGGTMQMAGGSVTGKLWVLGAAAVHGGEIDTVEISSAGRLDVDGGKISGLSVARQQGELHVSGGSIGPVDVMSGGKAVISGGVQSDDFDSSSGGATRLVGGEFKINGVPVSGLGTVGNSVVAPIPFGGRYVITGVLADGTPVAFVWDDSDSFASGTLTLEAAALPAIGPALITASTGPVPAGIRQGQTLVVDAFGNIPSNFMAGAGSTVEVQAAGVIGENFEAFDAAVNIAGGAVGKGFDALAGTVANISGGVVGDEIDAHAGSIVNISGDAVVGRLFDALKGSQVNISGGTIGSNFDAEDGSLVNVTGGYVGENMRVLGSSTVTISGGALGDRLNLATTARVTWSGGTVGDQVSSGKMTIKGGDFRTNGAPIPGLNNIGDKVVFSPSATISGTLSDGTPFLLSAADGDQLSPVTLELTALPAVGPAMLSASADDIGYGIRQGQTLVVDDGAVVGEHYNVGPGAVVDVRAGGVVGRNLEVQGTANISGGTVLDAMDALRGSTVNISGGSVGRVLQAHPFSTFNMSGGKVDAEFSAMFYSAVNITGGKIGSGFQADSLSDVNIAGGAFGDGFRAMAQSTVELAGDDFRADGAPIPSLVNIGDALQYNVPRGVVLSGTLSDGTPFAFATSQEDSFANGTLTLRKAAVAPMNSAMIQVPRDAAPLGIREGQMLVLADEGALGSDFNAGRGSNLVVSGGAVGAGLEAVAARVDVSGGFVGRDFYAFRGSTITLSGGEIDHRFELNNASLTMTGGAIYGDFSAYPGSVVNISGGRIAPIPNSDHGEFETYGIARVSGGEIFIMTARSGSDVHFTGGVVDNFGAVAATSRIDGGDFGILWAGEGAVINMYGGAVRQHGEWPARIDVSDGARINIFGGAVEAELFAYNGSTIEFFGSHFFLDGVAVEELQQPGQTLTIVDHPSRLTGVLTDGSAIDIDLANSDWIGDSSIKLTAAAPTADYNGDGAVDADDLVAWQNGFGAGGAGDSDGDSDTDGHDFLAWQRQLGNSVGTSAAISAAVPEPEGLTLVSACVAVSCGRVRRFRKAGG